MQKNKNKKHNFETIRSLAKFSTIGLLFFFCILIGYLIGNYLDKIFNTSPFLMLIFVVIGMIAAFLEMWNMVKDQ